MEIFGIDAFSPKEVAGRVNDFCVVKARLPLLTMWMLGMLAGAFIGLGSLYFTLVVSDASLGFAAARVAGGVCFSLGLLLVVVAGAELFTGNNLLAMGWADGCVSLREVLRNWAVVCAANFTGAAGLAVLVYLSGHWERTEARWARLSNRRGQASAPGVERVVPAVLQHLVCMQCGWRCGAQVGDKLSPSFPDLRLRRRRFEHRSPTVFFRGDVAEMASPARRRR